MYENRFYWSKLRASRSFWLGCLWNSENLTELFPLFIEFLKIHDMTSYSKMWYWVENPCSSSPPVRVNFWIFSTDRMHLKMKLFNCLNFSRNGILKIRSNSLTHLNEFRCYLVQKVIGSIRPDGPQIEFLFDFGILFQIKIL